MSTPYEVLLASLSAYWAPYGEAFPAINVSPAGNWRLIGTAGPLNVSEEGVTLTMSQELFDVRVDGSAYPVKQGRTSEELTIAFTLFDLTLEQMSLVVNSNTVSTVGGSPAYKYMYLERGASVTSFGLLLRHPSPYNDALNMQWELHKVSHRGASEITMRRTAAAGLRMEFTAQADTTKPAGQLVGRVVGQTAA